MTEIGFLGPEDDDQIVKLREHLDDRGVESTVVPLPGFPDETTLELRFDGEPRVIHDGRDLLDVDAWYLRQFGFGDIERLELPDELTRESVEESLDEWRVAQMERRSFVGTMLRVLRENAPLVNPLHAVNEHARKQHHAHRLRQAGLRVPSFTTTNDPDAALAFVEKHGDVVYKPTAGARYVLEVPPEMIRERAEALETEPIFLQKKVEGAHHRVFVVGDEVVTAAEMTFERDDVVDYRVAEGDPEVRSLSDEVEEQCVQAMEASGFVYTGLDLILDEDDRAWFLECNPMPMFALFEDVTGTPVSERIADLLVETAKGEAPQARA